MLAVALANSGGGPGSGAVEAPPGGQAQALVTKTMLGAFGCLPAFDRFFRVGFNTARFGPKTLAGIERSTT